MRLTVPPIEISENDGFSNELDIFNRKPFGEALFNLIQNTDDELVVALDAPWGEGKSTFIKMWQGLLKEKEVPCVYFDAFENDYQTDPFLAISSQIYTLIGESKSVDKKEFKEKATSALKVIGRATLRVGIKAATAGVLDETILDDAGASTEASDIVDGYFSKQLTRAAEDKQSLKDFKECLATLGESLGGENQVVFIIDELDRCKPKFALSILESIKHLFSVPNITFLLVMNRVQLEEAVRCEYGREVDATKYLQKFISIWTTLPKPTDKNLLVSKTYLRHCLNRMDCSLDSSTLHFFEELITFYDLSFREIERSLTNFAIIRNVKKDVYESYSLISVFLAVIKVIRPTVYNKLRSNSISYKELLEQAELDELKTERWGYFGGHRIKWLLKFCLATDDEAQSLLQQGEPRGIGFDRRVLVTAINWLETFPRNFA